MIQRVAKVESGYGLAQANRKLWPAGCKIWDRRDRAAFSVPSGRRGSIPDRSNILVTRDPSFDHCDWWSKWLSHVRRKNVVLAAAASGFHRRCLEVIADGGDAFMSLTLALRIAERTSSTHHTYLAMHGPRQVVSQASKHLAG